MGRARTCRAGDSVTGLIISGRAAAIKSAKAQCRGAPQTLSRMHKRFGGCTFPTGQLAKDAGCLRSPLQRCLRLGKPQPAQGFTRTVWGLCSFTFLEALALAS